MNTHQFMPHLYYFLSVYKHKSFAKAAEDFHVSPSTVSYQIKMLEEKMNMVLLKRDSGQRTELTPEGEKLAKQCYGALRHLDQVLMDVVSSANTKEFRITAPVSFGTYILLPALEFVNRHIPGADFTPYLTNEILDISGNDIDIAIRNVPVNDDIECEEFMKVTYYAIGSVEYLKKMPPLNSFGDLNMHKLVDSELHDRDWGRIKAKYPELTLPEKDAITYIANNNSIVEAVSYGYGIGLIPDYVAERFDFESKKLVRVLEQYLNKKNVEIMDTLYICYPKLSVKKNTIKKIIALLAKYLKESNYIVIEK